MHHAQELAAYRGGGGAGGNVPQAAVHPTPSTLNPEYAESYKTPESRGLGSRRPGCRRHWERAACLRSTPTGGKHPTPGSQAGVWGLGLRASLGLRLHCSASFQPLRANPLPSSRWVYRLGFKPWAYTTNTSIVLIGCKRHVCLTRLQEAVPVARHATPHDSFPSQDVGVYENKGPIV